MLLSILIPAALSAPTPNTRIAPKLSALQRAAPQQRTQVVVVPEDRAQAAALGDALGTAWPDVWLEVTAGGLVQLSVNPQRLDEIAAFSGVRSLRLPQRAKPKGTVSEGVDLMFAQDWAAVGLDGDGVRVAILDVGFTGYEALLGVELPDAVETHFIGDYNGTEHGTAVAEIIHDIAPAAELVFYSFETEVEFLSACEQIQDNGEYLVNASIGFDNVWHADGTSEFSQAVDGLAAAGITWMAAAGNESDRYWVGNLTDTDGDNILEMDGEERLPVYVGSGYSGASIRWDEPFGSAGADLDLIVYDESGAVLASSEDEQSGTGNPYEYAWGKTDDKYVYVSIYDYSGEQGTSSAGLKAWIYGEWELGDGWANRTETLTLPADAAGAISVGAVGWYDEEIASYSSRGPTNDGRLKPDISAPTGVTTISYGKEAFDGTSAAAPHATGLAALLFQASDRGMTEQQIRDWLTENTTDLGDVGPDYDYGAGLLLADAPPDGWEGGDDSGIVDDDDTGSGGDSGYGDSGYGEGGGKGCGCSGAGGLAHLGAGLLSLGFALLRRRRS